MREVVRAPQRAQQAADRAGDWAAQVGLKARVLAQQRRVGTRQSRDKVNPWHRPPLCLDVYVPDQPPYRETVRRIKL